MADENTLGILLTNYLKLDRPVPEEALIERELGLRGSLLDFVEMSWDIVDPGSPFVNSWHIGLICEHLQAVYEKQIQHLLINVPPGCSKSRLTCVYAPTWNWLARPANSWLFASYDIDLTTRDAKHSLGLMRSDWFQQRWGDVVTVPGDPPIRDITNNRGGWRKATSLPYGKLTGNHPDGATVDDPQKANDLSKHSMKEIESWYGGALGSRGRDLNTASRIVIMQRIHEMDLSGLCADRGYVHLRLPMRYEEGSPCVTSIGKDPRTKNGELLCPERFEEKTVDYLEHVDLGPSAFAAQYQQRPVPEEGGIFKESWFKFYSEMPKTFDQMILSWDCAFKGEDSSDPVVGQVWGRKGQEFWLVDQVRGHMTFTETLEGIRRQAKKWPRAIEKLVEDKANGSAVIDTLNKEMTRLVSVRPEGGKESRAHAISHLIESGKVHFPQGAPWLGEFLHELSMFPAGRNDDQVDAMTQALNYMFREMNKLRQAMAKLREQGILR